MIRTNLVNKISLFTFVLLIPLFHTINSFSEEFRVGTGDKLAIVVYEHDDLSMDVRIGGDGTILLPFLGRIKVTGLTTGEISKKLTNMYVDEEYLINPQIIVSINEFKSRKASILGQVKKPGRYELDEDTTIMILITMASGYTGKASKKNANLIRKSDGKRIIEKKVDLDKIVKPGDIIIIPESIF